MMLKIIITKHIYLNNMEKKQTALKWLIEVLNLKGYEQTLNKALEMEKRQITDAYHAGIEDVIPYNYYDNTYKSKDNESNN